MKTHNKKIHLLVISFFVVFALTASSLFPLPEEAAAQETDVIIVGAGIAGLSAAWEAGSRGARVMVLDMSSVFGGHAVKSGGVLSIVDTPVQQNRGIADSPELAYRDFTEWGEDANPEWVRYYVNHSRTEIYDWLSGLGVRFEGVGQQPGNSVPRVHDTQGRGLGLVSPIYRECLKYPNIVFRWNAKVTGVVSRHGRITGVTAQDLRSPKLLRFTAKAVVLATGGFQSNLSLLREHWSQNFSFPERILIGSSVNAVGSGLTLAQQVGASIANLDHQWNYPWGVPDPRYADGKRGLYVKSPASIWINTQGQRFVNEDTTPKISLSAVLQQKPATYWAIFDEEGKRHFWIGGGDGGEISSVQKMIFDNPKLTSTAATLAELAAVTGLPASALTETVRRYNELVDKGDDADFQRFGPKRTPARFITRQVVAPRRIERAPFYAIRFFPLTRKSLGGVQIDLQCRVLDARQQPIRGLYAAGEMTGFAGINGKAGLEGTFLGPSLVTGRVAGRAVAAELKSTPIASTPVLASEPMPNAAGGNATQSCSKCHNLSASIRRMRDGYWHFAQSHRVITERQMDCLQCHARMTPYQRANHRSQPLAQLNSCAYCHGTK